MYIYLGIYEVEKYSGTDKVLKANYENANEKDVIFKIYADDQIEECKYMMKHHDLLWYLFCYHVKPWSFRYCLP